MDPATTLGKASATKRGSALPRPLPLTPAPEPAPVEKRNGVRRACETCGNEYDKAFEVILADRRHVFDCFECAIQALAPKCLHCGCRIVGHGVEERGRMFCCAHCAKASGAKGLRDRA
jgi:hypothetical protein